VRYENPEITLEHVTVKSRKLMLGKQFIQTKSSRKHVLDLEQGFNTGHLADRIPDKSE
jgi:hypothetical protein